MGDRPIWLGPWVLHDGHEWYFGPYWSRPFLHGNRQATRYVKLYPLPGERPLRAKARG